MADNSDFSHLHTHGEYSMLDGVGTIDHVVKVARQKGFSAIAQTEHGNVSGAIKFIKECNQKKDKKGNPLNPIKPIVGCEIYVVDDPTWRKPEGVKQTEERYHTIVLAKDWEGMVSLMGLLTKAYSETGFYYKPRVGWNDVADLKNCIVTTACVGGPLKHENWKDKVALYNEAFKEDFYLEIQAHNFPEQYENNRKAMEAALYTGRKFIVSNDFHYPNQEDCHAQSCLLAIRDKKTESSDNKWDFTPGLYMKGYDEMMAAFDVLRGGGNSVITPELAHQGIITTKEIVEKCNIVVPKFEVELPMVDTSELGTDDPDKALYELCMRGWPKRFANKQIDTPKYIARLKKELEAIWRLKFSKYFLLVWDLYRYCNKVGISYGPGRGSGAGSLVCYLLGITNADPLVYDLIFERFINPERVDLPDLDLDFEHERRDEIYQYMLHTYKHVAHIATYNGMNTKGVMKDVCRFKEVPLEEINTVCKEIDANTAKQDMAKLEIGVLEEHPEKYPLFHQFKARNYAVIDIAKVLEGQVKSTGIHAGGVIVANHPLEERAVVEYRKGDVTINWDMYDVGDMGLLKVDVLGSKTVSVLKYTKQLIEAGMEDTTLNFDNIPLDDKATLNNFDEGNTIGIFQFESGGMQKMLREMKPHDINTIITANAMYRPGPLQFKDTYVQNKKNPSLIHSTGNEALDRITKETFGVFIYQEQVMRIAVDVAGYTYPESDALRKKISKSKGKDAIEEDRVKFVKGCVEFGKLSDEAANKLFDSIVDFGRYCFNKSHATTYSLMAYYAMWCKTHFPCEFLAAQIAYSVDSADAKGDRALLKAEAKRLGVQYLPPDINASQKECTIEYLPDGKKAIRGGFNELDGIGNAVIEVVLEARKKGQFTSFQDFMDKLDNKRVCNIGVQEKLLLNQAFASLHPYKQAREIATLLRTKPQKSAKKKVVADSEQNMLNLEDLSWSLTALPQS